MAVQQPQDYKFGFIATQHDQSHVYLLNKIISTNPVPKALVLL